MLLILACWYFVGVRFPNKLFMLDKKHKLACIDAMEESINNNNIDVELLNSLGIKPLDVFSRKNDKYVHNDEDGNPRCSTWTISNGTAWDCPAHHLGYCKINCYGFHGSFTWDNTKLNKKFQGLVMQIADANWLFESVKYGATNTRLAKGNQLLAVRLNEVSDLTQELLDKWCDVCEMLLADPSTEHIKVFTYSKMYNLDFSRVAKLSNFCVNASETDKPFYEGGNCFNAVEKEELDSVEETETVKICNCDINCGLDHCGHCYQDNGLIINEELRW